MAETSQNARALRPTKRTDAKGRSAAPDADASVRGQEEAETHTSARGAARVAARKAAHQKQAQAEREQKAAEKAAKKAQKKAAKAAEKDSRGGFAFFKKGAAEKNDQVETGETTSLSVVNGANAGAGPHAPFRGRRPRPAFCDGRRPRRPVLVPHRPCGQRRRPGRVGFFSPLCSKREDL